MAVPIFKDRWITISAAVWLAGCSGGEQVDPNAPLPTAAGLTALQIAQNLYDNAPRTPANFYQEVPRDPQFFYTLNHLKNSDLDPAVASDPGRAEYEVCASNATEAANLELSHRMGNASSSRLLAMTETAEYFEYETDVPGSSQQRAIVRIFDCDFVDRSSVNLRAPNGNGGTINQRPLKQAPVRFLAEYSFQFSPYNNVGYQVLSSEVRTEANAIEQTLLIAELITGGGPAGCDRLTVFSLSHNADTSSGFVTITELTEWTIHVELTAGRAQICE